MSVQVDELSTWQRCRWNAYEVGLPLQLPVEAVSVCPTRVVPEIVGTAVFFGAAFATAGATASVAFDSAVAEPSAFVAVTRTRIACPASAPVSVEVLLVGPVTA